MLALCRNSFKTCKVCRLSNGFGGAQSSSEHLRTFSETFVSLWKIVGNPWKSLGRFRKFQSRRKSQAFDSEKGWQVFCVADEVRMRLVDCQFS